MKNMSWKVLSLFAASIAVVVAIVALPKKTAPTRQPVITQPATQSQASFIQEPCFRAALPSNPLAGVAKQSGLPQNTALCLFGLGTDFAFETRAQWTELTNGDVRLSGVLKSQSNPQQRFRLRMVMSQRTEPGAMGAQAVKTLLASNYSENGGPIDANTWTGFQVAQGSLVGLGAYSGVSARLFKPQSHQVQVGQGANNRNLNMGAFSALRYRVLRDSDQKLGLKLKQNRLALLTLDLVDSDVLTTNTAFADPNYGSDGGHAFILHDMQVSLQLESGAKFFQEHDGSARLHGVFKNPINPDQSLFANIHFGTRNSWGQKPFPPTDSPKKELNAEAYKRSGGGISPAFWHYYSFMEGELLGMGSWSGGRFKVELDGPSFQVGVGANGKNLNYGGSGWFTFTTLEQPENESFVGSSRGDFNLDFGSFASDCAKGAFAERADGETDDNAFSLPGIGRDFVFVAGGRLVEHPNGSALLNGEIVRHSDPNARFFVELEFGQRTDPGQPVPAGSPKLNLPLNNYITAGGPIDPASWQYYTTTTGRLIGMGAFAGATYELTATGPSLQVGLGANGKNIEYGASVWLDGVLTHAPDNEVFLPQTILGGDSNIDLGGGCLDCVQGALAQRAPQTDGQGNTVNPEDDNAFWMPGIGTDFVFSPGGRWNHRPDGHSILTGTIQRKSDPNARFMVQLDFFDRMDPDTALSPPQGSPYMNLPAEDYASAGGPIDPSTWAYFGQLQGELHGMGLYEGATLRLERRGAAFQMGMGANNKNHQFGGAGWFTAYTTSQPLQGPSLPIVIEGDGNFDLDGGCLECARAAKRFDGRGHAIYLPGIASDLVFITGGSFEEFADGSALLTGRVASESEPLVQFDVELNYSQQLLAGELGAPPITSPKLELPSESYSDNGGPIDPSEWRYYGAVNGTFKGLGAMKGAFLSANHTGPAFQVGLGASGRNLEMGGAGWLDIQVIQQPVSAPSLPASFVGDVNIDLNDNCHFCPSRAVKDASFYGGGDDHALWLPALAKDMIFEPGVKLVENPDGSLSLRGTVYSQAAPQKGFDVAVDFSTPRYNGEQFFPPSGSPKKELYSGAYIENGGPVDASTWSYYEVTSGYLYGRGDYEGGVLSVLRRGPAFQLGHGANGKNTELGGSGWIDLFVEQQPFNDVVWPGDNALYGDFNLNLDPECK